MRSIIIDGKPQQKERARVVNGHAYTPTRTANYEARIAYTWQQKYGDQEIFDEPVSVRMEFYFPIPTSWSKAKQEKAERGLIIPTVRPDLDNLVKTLDGLNGVAFTDDKLVVELFAIKRYSHNPRTRIAIEVI